MTLIDFGFTIFMTLNVKLNLILQLISKLLKLVLHNASWNNKPK